MSSSDSEDDCYGNIAQKLAKMKNSYQDTKIENCGLLDETNELDNIISDLKNNPTAKRGRKRKKNAEEDEEKPSIENDTLEPHDISNDLDYIIATNENLLSNLEKRGKGRRGRKNQKASLYQFDMFENVPLSVRTSKRSNEPSTSGSQVPVVDSPRDTRAPRGCGRARGRCNSRRRGNTPRTRGNTSRSRARGRGWRSIYDTIDTYNNTVIYSIGNTSDYPDQSDSVPLFSNPQTNDDVVLIEDEFDENEELSVKVYWQNCEMYKFTIRKFQKLSQIFEFFTGKEQVAQDKLLITYNDRIIKPDDTPESINYNISKFMDGGITNHNVHFSSIEDEGDIINGIKLKFQCQNKKKPLILCVRLDDKLQMAMVKCAEHLEMPVDRLKFEFDGDVISGNNTAKDLDLEGDECIDVKIIS